MLINKIDVTEMCKCCLLLAIIILFRLTFVSVLPLALIGRFGGCNCWDGSLVEGSRYFVDVVQGQYGENKTERYKKCLEILLHKNIFIYNIRIENLKTSFRTIEH